VEYALCLFYFFPHFQFQQRSADLLRCGEWQSSNPRAIFPVEIGVVKQSRRCFAISARSLMVLAASPVRAFR
jgi:hypothetical protein